MTHYELLDVRPLAGALGAEIGPVNLKDRTDPALWREVLRAFHEFHVITIHGQELSPSDLMRIGARFGEPCAYPFAKGLDGYEFITDVIKAPDERRTFGEDWHIDSMYLQKPPLATLLLSLQTPPYGGDTLFANTAAAYDALSPAMQRMADGLVGVASGTLKARKGGAREAYLNQFGNMSVHNARMAEELEARHPLVRTHPVTGRKSLYVSPIHTLRFDGFTEEESRPLIDFLCGHCLRPEFTARVRWQPNQLTVWDNRTTLHCAINDYHGHRRHMRRLTVGAEQPV
jgi:taurine dioxygenase